MYKSSLERFKKEKGDDDADVATTLYLLGTYLFLPFSEFGSKFQIQVNC